MNFFSKWLGKKAPNNASGISSTEIDRFEELKTQILENHFGPEHSNSGFVGKSWREGGIMDLYYYLTENPGTGIATKSLVFPDGSGPVPNAYGEYELIAFTRHLPEPEREEDHEFSNIARRFRRIFTGIGQYTQSYKLSPGDTCEIPNESEENTFLIFDHFSKNQESLMINQRPFHIQLVMEIHKPELKFAVEHGSHQLFDRLKEKGVYPYSDLDREPVV